MQKLLAALALTTRMALMTGCAVFAAVPSIALFGTLEFRSDSHMALPQWRNVLAGIERERASYAHCANGDVECVSRAVASWQAMLKALKGGRGIDVVSEVNRYLNQLSYRSDQDNWGKSDYWATPMEFLRGSGDCEDYAIAKYVSLRSLGFEVDQLRIVVVRDILRNLPHAVLAVYLTNNIYIMDNLSNVVLPQSRLRHYVPYYSVNEASRWAHTRPGTVVVSAAGASGRKAAPAAD